MTLNTENPNNTSFEDRIEIYLQKTSRCSS